MKEGMMTEDIFTKEDEKAGKEGSYKEMAERYPAALNKLISLKAEGYLKDPKLWELIDAELDKRIEGEHEARKAIFFTFNMRNVLNISKATDNLMINDEGGTGKDYVVSAVFDLIPDSEKDKRVRITPKVLAYLNDMKNNPAGWVKKCLYLEDVPNEVLNDDAFKVMSSADPNGITRTSIVINNTLKDINIVGKPPIVITIATASPRQELLRRYPICNLTSSVKQTEAILNKQADFAENGTSLNYNPEIKAALGSLARIKVKVPFAKKIASIFPKGNVIIRTHYPRFLDYIRSSCSLFQQQREQDKEGYYLATEQDYEIARDIMALTTSNQLMIPLTKLQKRILEKFEGLGTQPQAFQDLEKEMQNIAQERWLRKQLDRLVEYSFLIKGFEKREGTFRPMAVYSYNSIHKLELPSFKELTSCSNNSNDTNSSNDSNKSYTSYSPSDEYRNKRTICLVNSGSKVSEYTHLLRSLALYPDGMPKDNAIELWGEDAIVKAMEAGDICENPAGMLRMVRR